MSLEGKKGILQEMKDVAECMRLANANMLLLLAAAACSALAMLVNLGIVSLLFPLAEGLIKQNFTQLSGGWIGKLLHLLPLAHSDSTSMFCALLTMIYVLVVLKAALDYVLKLVIATQAEAASSQILMKLVDRYLRFGRSYLDTTNNEKINTEISRCTAWIVQQISGFHSLLSNFLMLCFYLVLMSIISWRLTLSLGIVVPVIVLSIRYCITRLEGVAKTRTKSADDLKIKTAELIKRVNLVQPSGTIARELTTLSQRAKHQFTVASGYQRLASLIDPLHEVGTTTAQLILAWMLALVSSSSSLEPSHVFVFFYLSSKVIPLCNLLNQFRNKLAAHAGGMEILRSVMSDEDKAIIAAGHRHFTGINDAISFENLSFSYNPETPVFDSLSFAIKAGSVTALVGETGAGKTTVAHLLLRLYDCNPNQIFLDKTDIRDFTLESIRKMIAFVPQDPIIFDDTLIANLCYELDHQPSKTEINDALSIVQMTQFVNKLPEGLESSLGDRGVRLSAGQRQRIALCRALLKNAPILILDEATASLDPRTEELVINALLDSVKGRTTLLISHKLSTVRYAEHICVLADHHIVQSGTLSELTGEEGPFTRCFNIEKGAPLMA